MSNYTYSNPQFYIQGNTSDFHFKNYIPFVTINVYDNSTNILIGSTQSNSTGEWSFSDTVVSVNDKNLIINQYNLSNAYPNPFNPNTTISYVIPFLSKVNMDIYDISGSLVKSFEIGSQSAGRHQIIWDGTNQLGVKVASDIYLYKFRAISYEGNGNPLAKGFQKTAKLLLMK